MSSASIHIPGHFFLDLINRRIFVRSTNCNFLDNHNLLGSRVETECDGTRKRTGGEVKGKKANGGGSQHSLALYRTRSIQHYYR